MTGPFVFSASQKRLGLNSRIIFSFFSKEIIDLQLQTSRRGKKCRCVTNTELIWRRTVGPPPPPPPPLFPQGRLGGAQQLWHLHMSTLSAAVYRRAPAQRLFSLVAQWPSRAQTRGPLTGNPKRAVSFFARVRFTFLHTATSDKRNIFLLLIVRGKDSTQWQWTVAEEGEVLRHEDTTTTLAHVANQVLIHGWR